jgi:prephenate dehydratase
MSASSIRVAFQGVFGAFSHEACMACVEQGEPVPFASFEAAFQAVRDGVCDLAFLPVENSTAGPVPEVAALLPASGLKIVSEHAWPIHIQLLALPGIALSDVEAVVSHPMALKQCGRFLRNHGLREEPGYDTAGAARTLAEQGDRRRAAAAARPAAALYGLHILAEDIEDAPDNTTRFLLLRP